MGLLGVVLWWWALGADVLRFLTDLNVPAPAWAVTGILIWVAAQPFRNVGWVFLERAFGSLGTVWFFVQTCSERFRQAVENPLTQAMSPAGYAWGLVGLSFHVPIAVLEEYESRFGSVGKLCLKWTDAYHYTACVFSPDVLQTSWSWSCMGAKGYVDASKAAAGRTGDFVFGIYLLITLAILLVVYVPCIPYDLLEGVLQGWKGVALVLLAWNCWFGFESCGLCVSAVIVGLGLYNHLMRLLDARLSKARVMPNQVADRGWSRLRARMEARGEIERSDVERLERAMLTPPAEETEKELAPDHRADSVPVACAVNPEDEVTVAASGDRPVSDDGEEARRGRRVTVGENCHGPPPDFGLTMLADCMSRMLAVELQRRVSDGGPPAFRA
jgi:hypothetical protein